MTELRNKPLTSDQIFDQVIDAYAGAKPNGPELLALNDVAQRVTSNRYARDLRRVLVDASNSRSIWQRLTGTLTPQLVEAQSSLRIQEQKIVAFETEVSRRVIMPGYLQAESSASDWLDRVVDAMERERELTSPELIAAEEFQMIVHDKVREYKTPFERASGRIRGFARLLNLR